ncbi:uncharacterized protein LOC113548023 isoform X1 [Rhopalosiphum maidis]|uniref:uncharacterized protein LOC113548023 isoform X1 n=2 Tax=Rhopalosiphum maidis TaxID=43146 RepID=UPI000EFEA1D3|nr:uncharacterized protein LOC113548023 isoform X1 [Rhopalosiphum maidis]XP_026804463.1 uncharacterized protein LOC113548023 isoform X1 [Rhopalosiphum maidis]
MGCAPSTQGSITDNGMGSRETGIEAYQKVERDIAREEQAAPAPSLGHEMAKLDRFIADIENLMSQLSQERIADVEITSNDRFSQRYLNSRIVDESDNAIRTVMAELRINLNQILAIEHEEFIANLNRKSIKLHHLNWLSQMRARSEEEISKLSVRVQHLQKLYESQELIIKNLVGNKSSNTGQLERELDRVRSYRDTLVSGELSWKDATLFAQDSADYSRTAYKSWHSLRTEEDESIRFRQALKTRDSMHQAALCVRMAQTMLPGVQFPYCTSREVFAILQVIEYLFTDLQVSERFGHALEVYKSFNKRATALTQWLKQTTDETIHKDVEEVDERINDLANTLSQERTMNRTEFRETNSERYNILGSHQRIVTKWLGDTIGPKKEYIELHSRFRL